MKIENEIKTLLEKLKTEKVTSLTKQLEGSDFGLYIPAYLEGDEVKLMLPGFSQTERDLVISISKDGEPFPEDTKPVAWFRNIDGRDSNCTHGGTQSCTHCTGHSAGCNHCSGHSGRTLGDNFNAPELNYNSSIEQLINYKDLLKQLANEGFGIALLHGHSEEYMFTKLPLDYVSVITDGVTSFRKIDDVKNDSAFIPNMWRINNGQVIIAGGFSKQ